MSTIYAKNASLYLLALFAPPSPIINETNNRLCMRLFINYLIAGMETIIKYSLYNSKYKRRADAQTPRIKYVHTYLMT